MSARRLQLCGDCRRQLDVTALEPGTLVRCPCGAQVAVAAGRPHTPRALRCSNCGGNLRAGAPACEYCAAEITLDELRLDSLCPDCGARMSSGARYCMECGIAIAPQAALPLARGGACPRCRAALRERAAEALRWVECTHCAGIWLEPAALDELCARAEQDGAVLTALGLQPEPLRAVDASAVRYLGCVRCGEPMHWRNFGGSSGLILDVCKHHGVWLDDGELERAVGFARGGGLQRAKERELERRRGELARGAGSGGLPPLPLAESGTDLEIDLAALGLRFLRGALRLARGRAA
ncbi:MAG: zinc ribbon domain-containing protein [Planctomycetes bacterium]|nr:zinc ribbon domain-containing protein [Planctomycetota bacterium]